MPTSIGHALGGYATAHATSGASARRLRLGACVFLAVFVANAPDLDFLPGLLLGHAERFHRGRSHSLVGAALASLVLAPVASRVFSGSVRRWTLLVFAVYLSHLVLDLLMRDPTGGPGIELLWPFTAARFALNLPGQAVLDPIRTLEPGFFKGGIFSGLLRPNTIMVFVVDAVLVSPALLFLLGRRARQGQPDASATPDGDSHVVEEVVASVR